MILTWWNISLLKKHRHVSNAIMHNMLTIDWLNCLISHHSSIWTSRRFWNGWRLIEVHVGNALIMWNVEWHFSQLTVPVAELLQAFEGYCSIEVGCIVEEFYFLYHLHSINFHENRLINRICLCKHYYWPILLLGQQTLVDDLFLEPHVKPSIQFFPDKEVNL